MVSEKAKRSYSLAIAAAKSFSGIVKKQKKLSYMTQQLNH
jgi:hypothetical protein